MKRILVTGVGGNVGQYIANDLAHAGYEVIGIYRNSIPQYADYELMQANLSETILWGDKSIDIVVHIAASISGDANTLIRDNIDATKNLVCWAEQAQVRRFIYMSSVAVYGCVEGELCEESNINDPSIYGITKHLGEVIVREAEIPEKLILQLPKMIGPYVHMENTKGSGFLTMTKKILNNEKVICYIPEMEYNNYLHVAELGAFLQHLLQQDCWGEERTALVGAQERLTMLQILQTMKSAAESKSEIISQSNGTMPEVSLINISKAEALGFSPCKAEDMLRRFVREIHGG